MIFLRLFLSFAKIGLIGFGGGLAILPLIYQSAMSFSNMSADEFASLFAISQATPGPMAVNAATFVGLKVAGIWGAVAATLGVSVPSFVLVSIVAGLVEKNRSNPLVEGAFAGIRPAAVGMIFSAVVFIGETALFEGGADELNSLAQLMTNLEIVPAILAVVTLILVSKTKLGAIKLIIIMGVAGAFLCS